MKRLLLPITILFTTTLGISSATFAQTNDSQLNSENLEATEQPIPNSKPNQQKQKAYMGIQLITLVPKSIEAINSNPDIDFKVPNTQGIFIAKVIPNSAAANAGLRQGDVIKEVSGKSTTTAKEIVPSEVKPMFSLYLGMRSSVH